MQFIYYNTSGRFTLHSDAAIACTALRLTTVLIYLYDQPSASAGKERREGAMQLQTRC